jgi:hypothetical protein
LTNLDKNGISSDTKFPLKCLKCPLSVYLLINWQNIMDKLDNSEKSDEMSNDINHPQKEMCDDLTAEGE